MIKMLLILVILMNVAFGAAASGLPPRILFIPHDDRPVSLDYTADTLQAAGFDIVTPPRGLLGARGIPGNADGLWVWLMDNLSGADAAVISGDMLLYGGLVESRRHTLPNAVISARLANLKRIKESNPNVKLYVFTSIMRSPKFSAGGVEPDYYDQYGPAIFRITALEDKQEADRLTAAEKRELKAARASVPADVMEDWLNRRRQNFSANAELLQLTRQGVFDLLVLGRDDNAPYSQTHRENRALLTAAAGLSPARFQSIPGVDELAMVLLTKAANDSALRVPIVTVRYAPGVGPETVPSYSDEPIGRSVNSHLFAAGMIPLPSAAQSDFTLLVNTDADGITREASSPANRMQASPAARALAEEAQRLINQQIKVVIADAAYANGADNGLMNELKKRRLLSRLTAYSGWNTPNNTVGFAIGQGMLALNMTENSRKRLLAVRLLDDWAYQANIRTQLVNEVLVPLQGDYFYLNSLQPVMTQTAQQKIDDFAVNQLSEFDLKHIQVSFPWNRMFELAVEAAIKN
jgi:hypothetical protein